MITFLVDDKTGDTSQMNAFKLECDGGRVYVGICDADRDAMQQRL